MSIKIKGDLLEGDNVKFVKTPNHGGAFTPDTIVLHYTAGPSLESAIRTLTNAKVSASAHLIIDRDGSIVQLAPFNIVTWHAGQSSYAGRVGYNNYSIGIEMVNEGPLTKSGSVYRSWSGQTYEENEVIEAIHRNQNQSKVWQVYTPEQIKAVEEVCHLLVDTYDIKYILGHEEIAPQRKMDPGPAFPLDKLRDRILNANRNDDSEEVAPDMGRVGVNKLNIRTSPDSGAEPVAKPLTKDTKVKILEQKGDWYRVAVEVEGWVFSKYIDNV